MTAVVAGFLLTPKFGSLPAQIERSVPSSVPNISALITLHPSQDSISIDVQAFRNPGDGGSGKFLWKAESTETPDGGTIFGTVGMQGRWIRQFDSAQGIDVRWFGAFGNGNSHPLTKINIDNCAWLKGFIIGDEWDTVALQLAINAAQKIASQDHTIDVHLAAGTYIIYRSMSAPTTPYTTTGAMLKLASNIRIEGESNHAAILTTKVASGLVRVLRYDSGNIDSLENFGFYNLTFKNIAFEFFAYGNHTIRNLTMSGCSFTMTKPGPTDHTEIVLLQNVTTATIGKTTFDRASTGIGIGIIIYQSHGVTVEDSNFAGYFIGELYVQGNKKLPTTYGDYDDMDTSDQYWPDVWRSTETVIQRNTFSTLDKTVTGQSHLVYVWGAHNVTIQANTFIGKPSLKKSGVKLRNSSLATITGNQFIDCGITLATLKSKPPDPATGYVGTIEVPFLYDITITDNTITNQSPDFDSGYINIYYWRNYENDAPEHEHGIDIERNIVRNGFIGYNPNTAAGAFTIKENTASGYAIPRVPRSVPNISALIQLRVPLPDKEIPLNVEAFRNPGDGGGGTFIWNAESTDAPDGGIVFGDPTAGPGRWIRQFDPAQGIDVRWFGAFGDGNSHPLTELNIDNCSWLNGFAIGDEWDTVALQLATNAAERFATFVVPSQ
jgi:hypothetical protein